MHDYQAIARPTWRQTLAELAKGLVCIIIGLWLIQHYDIIHVIAHLWSSPIDELEPNTFRPTIIATLAVIGLIFSGTDTLSTALIAHFIDRYDQPQPRPQHGTKYLDPDNTLTQCLFFYLISLCLLYLYLFNFSLWTLISSLPLLGLALMCRFQLQHHTLWRIDYRSQTLHSYRFHRFWWQHAASYPLSRFCGIAQHTQSDGHTDIILFAHQPQPQLFYSRIKPHPHTTDVSPTEKQLHRATGLPILRRKTPPNQPTP